MRERTERRRANQKPSGLPHHLPPPPVGRRRPSAPWQWEGWRDLNTTRPQGCLEVNNMRSPPAGLFWSPALWRKLNTTLTTWGRSENDLDLEFDSTLEAKKQKICCFLYRLQTHRLTCKFLFLNVWEFCFGFLFYCWSKCSGVNKSEGCWGGILGETPTRCRQSVGWERFPTVAPAVVCSSFSSLSEQPVLISASHSFSLERKISKVLQSFGNVS